MKETSEFKYVFALLTQALSWEVDAFGSSLSSAEFCVPWQEMRPEYDLPGDLRVVMPWTNVLDLKKDQAAEASNT